jgi:hypothetical protein
MGLLDGLDFSGAANAMPDFASLLLQKGQQLGGLLFPGAPQTQKPDDSPFNIPAVTPSLNSAPSPEVNGATPAVPLPQPRPDGAAPTAPTAAPPSFLDKVSSGINDNSGMLLGLASGLSGAPSWGTGISRGFAGAAAGAQADASSAGGNMTVAALLKKGVAPEVAQAALKNKELMNTLVQEHFGHSGRDFAFRQEEAKRAQLNADRTFALAKRSADRADDPTPTNFVKDDNAPGGYRPIGPADPNYLETVAAAKARAAAAVPPEGFTQGPDGALAPRTGGPTDPAYLGRVDAEKARAKGDIPTVIGPNSAIIVPNKASEGPVFTNKPAGSGGLSQDALDIRAAQWNNGDYEGATKNVGRGAQGGATLEAIANRAAERLIEQGHSPEAAAAHVSANMQKFKAAGIGQNAESRTSATREANLNLILKATDAAIPAALEQSEKVARTGWVPLNKIIQRGQILTSDPELKKFGMANLQLAEHWARAMNPTGVMRESDRDLALNSLSTADSHATYKALVNQLKVQITRERDAVRAGNGAETRGGGTPVAAAPDPLGLR